MSASRRRRQRRHRRTAKQVLAYGPAAKRRHARQTGRTGHIHAKRLRTLLDRAQLLRDRLRRQQQHDPDD